MTFRKRLIRYITIILVNVLSVAGLAAGSQELEIQTFAAALGVCAAFFATQVVYWWAFINFFSFLPVWLYPLLTFLFSGSIFMVLGNLIPGVWIASVYDGIKITVILTLVNAVLASLLSLDIESKFDSNVTRKLASRFGSPVKNKTPGFIFLEIDGLGEKAFQRAMAEGHLPTLKRWMDEGTHHIVSWETDFSSQTCAMQTGILMGNNDNVPAYRWWDREKRQVMVSALPGVSMGLEKHLSSGKGLLSEGGASRGNMFSGDAAESIFTSSTIFNRGSNHGPGFYWYLASPYAIASLVTSFLGEVIKEWWQALQQRLRRDPYRISARTILYAFQRAAAGPLLHNIIATIVISDILRGLPTVYATFCGYDEVAHFAGMETQDAFDMLNEIDRYFARIERSLSIAPRPYHIVILSDHGQSTGLTFHAAYGMTLEQLVKGSINGDKRVYASLNTNEAWDKINDFMNESIHANTRTARVLSTLIRSRTRDKLVVFGPDRNPKNVGKEIGKIEGSNLVVLASGCVGLIYFTHSAQRMTYEEIQRSYPDLLVNLVQHPGIGFVLVHSSEQGDLVLGKEGIHFLDQGTWEGEDPLRNYSARAAINLRRESGFLNCPDILVNSSYDPTTGEISSFENQVSHHGGLGGPQNRPFIFSPVELPVGTEPVIGAIGVNRLLQCWINAAFDLFPN